jgi:hypothetical protein
MIIMSKCVSLLLLAALGINACAVEEDVVQLEPEVGVSETEGSDEASEPELEQLSQALGAPRLHTYQSVHYAGNIFEEDHFPIWGGDCSPGYTRVDFPRARWNGNGACEFMEWDNPDNVRDCRAIFHVHTNAFWGSGTCQGWIYEERAPAGSCRDPRGLRCGGASADGSCFCDAGCEAYGDCCLDYRDHC